MSACNSQCDCDGPELGIEHSPECHSHQECGESGYCDKHFQEEMREHQWLARASKYTVIPIDQDFIDEMVDAGRGHLVLR